MEHWLRREELNDTSHEMCHIINFLTKMPTQKPCEIVNPIQPILYSIESSYLVKVNSIIDWRLWRVNSASIAFHVANLIESFFVSVANFSGLHFKFMKLNWRSNLWLWVWNYELRCPVQHAIRLRVCPTSTVALNFFIFSGYTFKFFF